MKKILLSIIVLLMVDVIVNAQDKTSGKVIYQQVIKLDFKLEGEAAQYANMLPKEQKSLKVLFFSPEATLFENDNSSVHENVSSHADGANITFRLTEPDNKIFIDLKNNTQTEQQDFMTRTFLIAGETQHNWKLTGQQKLIMEYPCQEAVMDTENDTVSAWFTPAIPVSGGPANYNGLPGLILDVSSSGGKKNFTAVSVDFSPLPKDILKEPAKGKKITREEFEKIVEEKTKEMGVEQGGNGTHIVIGIRR